LCNGAKRSKHFLSRLAAGVGGTLERFGMDRDSSRHVAVVCPDLFAHRLLDQIETRFQAKSTFVKNDKFRGTRGLCFVRPRWLGLQGRPRKRDDTQQ
ncbi:MAG: hypothetical protein D6743_01230, partial [Calditrichaeota bacterium]